MAQYCIKCGSPLEDREIDGTPRRACTNCDYVHWGNYSIGVGAVVWRDDRVLLVRRAQNPGKGNWTVPGGYIEQQEPIEATVEREVLEETGVTAKVSRIIAIRDQPRDIHNVYIVFMLDYIDGEPKCDGFEVDAAGFYSWAELEEMKVAGLTRWLLEASLKSGGIGLNPDRNPGISLPDYGLFRV